MDNYTSFMARSDSCSSETSLDEKLFIAIQSSLVQGMYDANFNIQKRAIYAAKYFQSPKDKLCPVISCYLRLLETESLIEIRLAVLECIAINSKVFALIKEKLIFDSEPRMIEKLIEKVVLKKIPTEFIDARFNQAIIDSILRLPADRAQSLFDDYLEKSIGETKSVLHFIKRLNLRNEWYNNSGQDVTHDFMVYKDAKLFRIMDTVYKICARDKYKSKLDVIDSIVCMGEFHNLDLNRAFFLRSYVKLVNNSFLDEKNMELEIYLAKIKERRSDLLLTYQLIDIIEYLDECNLNKHYVVCHLIESLDSELAVYDLNNNEDDENEENSKGTQDCFIYELVLSIFEDYGLEFFKDLYLQANKEEQALKIYSILISKMSKEDFENAERVYNLNTEESIDEEEGLNIIEHLMQNFILTQVGNLKPYIRALAFRCLSQVAMLNLDIALSYVQLFQSVTKIFINIQDKAIIYG
jgi:hypothetical protein